MSADKELSVILEKMKARTADFEDMQRYSLRTAEIRAEVLKENLSPAGNGQNEEACIQILKDQHEDVFQKESAVQKALDQKQNIHISPKKPKFPAERARKAAHSLEDETVPFETIQRRAENAVANIANSFHDDYIKENAEFRQNTGLKCHVIRLGASKCCSWCAEVAGRYEVGKEPADFWRRHDHCSCRMDYENQKVHQRLSGTSKGWKVDSEVQRRQAQRIEYKPVRFLREEAKALESEKLSQIKGLTNQAGSGTINIRSNGKNRNYLLSDEHTIEKIGKIDFNDKKAISKLLSEFETKYSDSKVEHCIVFATNGEIYEVHGDKDTVNTEKLGDLMFGSINEHNHVTGESQYSFSWEDLKTSVEDGTHTMIAYDEKYRYFIVFGNKQISVDDLENAYLESESEVGDKRIEDIFFKRPFSISDEDYRHEVVRRTCEKVGVKYARQSRKTT